MQENPLHQKSGNRAVIAKKNHLVVAAVKAVKRKGNLLVMVRHRMLKKQDQPSLFMQQRKKLS